MAGPRDAAFNAIDGAGGMWDFGPTMKTRHWTAIGIASAIVFSTGLTFGQATSATALTRKVVPAKEEPAPQQPAQTKPGAPSPQQPSQPTAAKPPPAPVVREKSQQEKDEITRKTVAFQKQRAEAGAASAQYDLGVRYLTGDGVEKDPETARKWIEASAKQGYSMAVRKLEELNKSNP